MDLMNLCTLPCRDLVLQVIRRSGIWYPCFTREWWLIYFHFPNNGGSPLSAVRQQDASISKDFGPTDWQLQLGTLKPSATEWRKGRAVLAKDMIILLSSESLMYVYFFECAFYFKCSIDTYFQQIWLRWWSCPGCWSSMLELHVTKRWVKHNALLVWNGHNYTMSQKVNCFVLTLGNLSNLCLRLSLNVYLESQKQPCLPQYFCWA